MRPSVDLLLALVAPPGAGLLLGFLAAGGELNATALLLGLCGTAVVGSGVWFGIGHCVRNGRSAAVSWRLGGAPCYPWVAGWPLALQAGLDANARAQLYGARWAVAGYLAGWTLAGLGALALWLRALPAGEAAAGGPPDHSLIECDAAVAGGDPVVAGGGHVAGQAAPTAWWIAAPMLALAGAAYWNGAVLGPLQYRGFPDYVTQLGGARRLLAGALPYDPALRVWADVNLPPITLLVLFAPFVGLSELGGKLAYFLVNQLAFGAALATVLVIARPTVHSTPTRVGGHFLPASPLVWGSTVIALALTFEPWHDSLRLGQQNGIVLLCLALSLAALLAGRDALSGVALAAALIGKPSSALLGLYFLFTGRWRAVAAGAGAGLLAVLLALPWTGWEAWRFYLLEKAPQILAGTPQQSNVALLALHARLFLPPEALSSFDAMPYLPAAQTLTRVAQLLGALALWRIVHPGAERRRRTSRLGTHVEFAIALVLSLSLVGHAWQSYVTWLILAMVPLADPALWGGLPRGAARWVAGLAVGGYAAVALNDVWLYKVIGNTTAAATVFASLPNVMFPVLAFALAMLRAGEWQRIGEGEAERAGGATGDAVKGRV